MCWMGGPVRIRCTVLALEFSKLIFGPAVSFKHGIFQRFHDGVKDGTFSGLAVVRGRVRGIASSARSIVGREQQR